MSSGLPPFTLERPSAPRTLVLTKEEKTQVDPLVKALIGLVRNEVTGMDLLETFLG